MPIQEPDLTKRAPRSPRVRLGGYAILPRMLDKGRAQLAGKIGEYHFNCPLDQQFTSFTGIDAAELQKQLALDKGDGEILDWIIANAKKQRTPPEIAEWTAFQDRRGPADLDSHQFFTEYHGKVAPKRGDVATWFDILDIDDHISFGGKA
jgi:hypothetical protein